MGTPVVPRVLAPPPDMELADEPDPLEKENRDLRRELLALKERRPALTLGFVGGDGHFQHSVPVLADPSDDMIDQVTSAAMKRYPPSSSLQLRTSMMIPVGVLKQYDKDRETYFQSLRAYLAVKHEWDTRACLSVPFRLALSNAGSLLPRRGAVVSVRGAAQSGSAPALGPAARAYLSQSP